MSRFSTRALWPFKNVYEMATADPSKAKPVDTRGTFSGGPLKPYQTVGDIIADQFGQLPKILIAVLCWQYTVDMHAASLGYSTSWVAKVFARDLFLMVAICGLWDWILYFSPLKDRLHAFKINKAYPNADQFRRDVLWTTIATLLGSVQEVVLMRWWAGGSFRAALFGTPPDGEAAVPWDTPFFGDEASAVFSLRVPLFGPLHFHAYTAGFLAWTVTMLHWRLTHFFFLHRGMHPWWARSNGLRDGDVGAFLYRWVHSHHHKSYNPTAFSGFSMTPVESVGYLSAAFVPLFFRSGCHPWIHLPVKILLQNTFPDRARCIA